MKDKKLNELSDEELLRKEKLLRMVSATLAGAIIVLVAANLFLSFKKGFSALHVIPVAFLPIVIINFTTLKEIKKEMKARNLS